MAQNFTALRDKTFTPSDPVMVTVCTLAFNHGDYLSDCLEGILDQRCDFRVEVIVHDDASTDGTAEVLKEYQSRYPSIVRVISQTENLFSKGVNPQYAYILPASRGTYFAICDGDDFWKDPDKLAQQVAFLETSPDYALTYGPTKRIDAQGNVSDHKGGASSDLTAEQLKSTTGLNTLTTCGRNVFRGAPPMYLRSSPIGDLTMWAMLGYHGGGKYIADLAPAFYRVHDGGILSRQNSTRQNMMSMLGHLSIAAYHLEQGDRNACYRSAFIGLRFLVNVGGLNPRALLRLFVRAVKRRNS